jgi:SAM-dependent methyltransferase
MDARVQREKDFHDRSFAEHPRKVVRAYYDVGHGSFEFYQESLRSWSKNRKVLEYGCGPGSYAFFLARNDAIVTGIDISDVAIRQARARAIEEQLDITFSVMNAEDLHFGDDTFDLICGTGILHHLELNRAFSELTRTLRLDGRAIFVEPLGHNPFINLYRGSTGHLRTDDEHPLLMKDLRLARSYFGAVELHFFHLTSLMAAPFRRWPGFAALVSLLDSLDTVLFTLLPIVRRYAWIVMLTLSQPKKSGTRVQPAAHTP